MRKSSGALDNQSVAVLTYKDTAAVLVVAVAYCIEYGLSDNTLIERRNFVNDEAFLIVLLVVSKVYKLPDAVKTEEEGNFEFLSLVCGACLFC